MFCLERRAALSFVVLMVLGLGISSAYAWDWPKRGGDLWNTGYTYDSVLPPLALLWKSNPGGQFFASPAVVGGVVYVASYGENPGLYALNALTGTKLWGFSTYSMSSPAVSGGIVYVGSLGGYVYAVNATTGTKKWEHDVGLNLFGSPAVRDGIVYIGGGTFPPARFFALDAATGNEKWKYDTGPIMSTPALTGDVVYVGGNGKLYALDANNGNLKWNITRGGWFGDPVVNINVIYVGCTDDNVYALDAETGAEIWSYKTNNAVYSAPAVLRTISYTNVYVGSRDGYVYALNGATGEEIWKFKTGGDVCGGAIVSGSVIYVGSEDGYFYCLDAATGVELWKFGCDIYLGIRGWIVSRAAVSNGVVYMTSEDRNVYAFVHGGTVTFSASGLGGDASGTVLTVDGVDYDHNSLPKTFTWIIGSQHTYEWTDMASPSSGKRYVWNSTTGLAAGRSGTISVPDASSSISASYKTQYYMTIKSPYDSPTGEGWYDNASTATSSVESPISGGTGIHYVCTGWSGTGSAPTSGTGTSVSFAIDAPSNVTWNWKTQHYLTVESPYGSPTGQGWHDAGSTVSSSVSSTVPDGEQVRQVCTGWTGTGSASSSGTDTTATFTIDSPSAVTWNWKRQYKLTVSSQYGSPTGGGWYDDGSPASSSVSSPVSGGTGILYICTGWTGTGSAPSSGTDTTVNFTVTAATNMTWNWETEYYLTVKSPYGSPTGEGWYDAGSEATISVEDSVPMEGLLGTLGAKWVFSQWTGDFTSTDPTANVPMDDPKQVLAVWKEDYLMIYLEAAALLSMSVASLHLLRKYLKMESDRQ